jgi:hypothetical protein
MRLRIPNLIAAERIGTATLARLGLRLEDVELAFQNIVNTGDILQALSFYRQIICRHDINPDEFKKTEEHHRDTFYITLLGNSHASLRRLDIEAKITKVSNFDTNTHLLPIFFGYKISLMYANVSSYSQLSKSPGRSDMPITVQSAKRITILEWKVLQLDYLDLGTPMMSVENKANLLKGNFGVRDILNVNFAKRDRFRRGKTIKEWILTGARSNKNVPSPRQQLAGYMDSPEIAELKTDYTVCWQMDHDGQFREKDARLAA